MVLNVHVHNSRVLNLWAKTNRNKEGNIQIDVGDFNIPPSVIDRTCRQKSGRMQETQTILFTNLL